MNAQPKAQYTPEYVGERLKLAAETDRKLPRVGQKRVRAHHPDTLPNTSDQFAFGENWRENLKHRVDAITRVSPTRESIREMEEAQEWLQMLTLDRRRALWAWACGIPDRFIAMRAHKSRQTIWNWREQDLAQICGVLNHG